MKVVKVRAKNLTRENIIRIVKADTGISEDINLDQARVYKINDHGDLIETSNQIASAIPVADKTN